MNICPTCRNPHAHTECRKVDEVKHGTVRIMLPMKVKVEHRRIARCNPPGWFRLHIDTITAACVYGCQRQRCDHFLGTSQAVMEHHVNLLVGK